ncbi:hypothetical protein LEP1GSC172_0869 [Leptospira noguchii]|uniref:Uncharacterized protein n=1 Tax=Leptospira noguchii TaxID=28182 RepID=M6VCA4_9LEPT|nr:hypothetical protein LEP1GSC172_0869 [Leptospira noguchii]
MHYGIFQQLNVSSPKENLGEFGYHGPGSQLQSINCMQKILYNYRLWFQLIIEQDPSGVQ